MPRSNRSSAPRLAALLALPAALAWPALSGAADDPKIIPLPRPPQGPPIHRVAHDAARPVEPGSRVQVRVIAAPGASVSVSLGPGGPDVPCPARAGEEGTYACEVAAPDAPGSRHVVATATDREGYASRLSSVLPVVISARDLRDTINSLNARLAPVLFASGSSRLDGSARKALEAGVELLRSRPDLPLRVEGHCDPGEEGDHAALSLERARAVADELDRLGIPPGRVSVEGLASSEPVVSADDEEARAVNRRVMILFLPGPGAAGR